MKSKINFLLAAITLIIVLESCLKDHSLVIQILDDKLLLSKVTGTIQGDDLFESPLLNNFNTYEWNGTDPNSGLPNSGTFKTTFSYRRNNIGWNNYGPILNDSFLNKGHYDFLYNSLLPDKVIDNSIPGYDLGYWKFYYNLLNQVSKIGLGFSSTTDPQRFEYYSRDYYGKISSFVYGRAVDTPYMTVRYQYDLRGNISNFYIYVLKNASPGSLDQNRPAGIQANKPNGFVETASRMQALKNRAVTIGKFNNNSVNISANLPSTGVDTSVYQIYLTAKVTTDAGINPYSQQDNIFFYQTNRWYSFYDVTPFFQALLKSNPLKIDYEVLYWYNLNPQVFPDVSAEQTFSYTYNNKGYPITIHELFSDPNDIIVWDYTRDSQLEYVSNR